MTVGVGVIGEGHLVSILQVDQPGHSVRARAIHPNPAVMIDRHEGKCGINREIYDRDIQSVDGVDRFPISEGGSAQRVNRQSEARIANGVHVDDILQILHVGQHQIFLASGRCFDCLLVRNSFHLAIAGSQEIVRPILYPARDLSIGRAAVRRVVLETTVFRRIVGRCDDNTVRQTNLSSAVVHQNGM